MNNYYFLYYFFDNIIIRWIRVFIFFGVSIFVYLNLDNPTIVLKFLPIYFVLLLQELYIHFRLENTKPQKTVGDDINHPIDAVDYRMRSILERTQSTRKVIGAIKSDTAIKYMADLLDVAKLEIQEEINEEELLRKAFLLATQVDGKYIHPIDIYASYIILQDKTTQNLFNIGLSENDIVVALSWTRKKFRVDSAKNHGLNFTGSGIFDFLIYGWSAELSKYASNFTKEVLSGMHPDPIGYSREYDLLVTALSKSSSSNALLIGEPGVGKSTLVAKLVEDSNMGLLPRSVSNKMVFRFYPERLLAGIENQGDLEERLISLLNELYHSGNTIVLIPNIESIFGGGGLNIDMTGAIIDYLKSNRIKIIGTTTNSSYKEFIYAKQEARELFDIVEMEEPESDTVMFMLLEKAYELESTSRVKITYSAVKSLLELSESYINDGTVLPGRAAKLLEDCISWELTHGTTKITKDSIRKFVESKTKIVLSDPSKEETDKLLNLESEMHKSVISQDEAIKAISDAMRRARSGMTDSNRPIASFLFLGPTGVGKTETAKALARYYFGDEKSMIRLDMTEYQGPDALDSLLGNGNETTLTDMVLNNPFSEILLDEFEKADKSIHDVFLQILDEGRLTDKKSRTVSFKNTIIIATSNAGSEFIREEYKDHEQDVFKEKLVERLLEKNIFKPELVNRFDDLIVFKPLSQNEAIKVAKIFLDQVVDEASKKQIALSYDDEVCNYIASNSYSADFGARNIKRFIQQSVENNLSKLILSNEVSDGSATIKIRDNSLVIES